MKYRILPLLCLGFVAAVRATEPEPIATTPCLVTPLARTGKVLLLDNTCLLQGDIERVDNQYRIRRLTGVTGLPARDVIFVGQTPEDAYRFLRARAALNDADEHMRLANWCRKYGLHDQALAELREVVRLRPNHPASRDLIAYLQRTTTPVKAEPRRQPEPPPPPPVDLTAEATSSFATRVQTILMNTCASCHATERNTSRFRLTRVWSSGSSNRLALEYNLAAVLTQVNLDHPEQSRLLTRAVIDHGHVGQPPLHDRKCRAYVILAEWVRRTVENNPQLREQLNVTAPPAETRPPVAVTGVRSWGAEHSITAPTVAAAPPVAPPAPAPPTTPTPPPATPTPPTVAPAPVPRSTEDVVDPDEFNRMAHPERAQTPPIPPPARPTP